MANEEEVMSEENSVSELTECMNVSSTYFRSYTVHVVELLNYNTNYCTYITFIKFIYVQ